MDPPLEEVGELVDAARETGKGGDGGLDDLVHDLKSQEASAINNDGLYGQCEYLYQELGFKEAYKLITGKEPPSDAEVRGA